jgi:CRP/FNR family cyclic AMP-dependent transcriptional regulator
MMDSVPQVGAMLSKMAIFKGLNRSQLEMIAARFEVVQLKKGERLFTQGEAGEHFFIIQSGEIDVNRTKNGVEQKLTSYATGDLIGE